MSECQTIVRFSNERGIYTVFIKLEPQKARKVKELKNLKFIFIEKKKTKLKQKVC